MGRASPWGPGPPARGSERGDCGPGAGGGRGRGISPREGAAPPRQFFHRGRGSPPGIAGAVVWEMGSSLAQKLLALIIYYHAVMFQLAVVSIILFVGSAAYILKPGTRITTWLASSIVNTIIVEENHLIHDPKIRCTVPSQGHMTLCSVRLCALRVS